MRRQRHGDRHRPATPHRSSIARRAATTGGLTRWPRSRTTSSRTEASRRPSTSPRTRLLIDRSLYDEADQGPEAFWARQARELLAMVTDFDAVLEWNLPFAQWFIGGS